MSSNVDFANQAPGEMGYQLDHPAAAHCRIVDRQTGEIALMGRKKIAIIGFASSTRHYVPVNDPDWICVGLNQIYRHIPRLDVHFDIHAYWAEDNVPGTDHAKWIRECGIPVYMTDPYLESPTTVRYPIERLIAKHNLDYFTSTISFELAWVIDCIDREVEKQTAQETMTPTDGHVATVKEAAEHLRNLYAQYTIGIYGIDLIVGTEYECVVPDTKVLTADLRWTPAGMLSVGQQLVGFDEHGMCEPGQRRVGRRYRTAMVTGADRIQRECSRITLADGTTMVVSSDHPWLVKLGRSQYQWKRTDQLDTPQHRHPSRIVKLADVWGQPVHSWDAGYLAAAFDGEGHLSGPASRVGQYGNIAYSQRDNAMAATVSRGLDTYGFTHARTSPRGAGNNPCETYRIGGGRSEVLRFLGQMRPQRLLAKFTPDHLGRVHAHRAVEVVSVEPVGVREVVALGTSTGTFIAEGFASHNTQKCCVEFWIGVGTEKGINFHVPSECALLKQMYRYGYEREPGTGLLKLSELTKRHAEIEEIKQKLFVQMHQLNGKLAVLNEVKAKMNGQAPEFVEAQLKEWQSLLERTVAELQTYDGAQQECAHTRTVLELRVRGGQIPLGQVH